MHLLLTNDDGIFSPSFTALAQAALNLGHEVTLCAPATQQSATGQSFTLRNPIFVKNIPFDGGNAFAVSGTPADCVRLGLGNLCKRPVDVVISGINKGYNAGGSVYCSGTVGAARQAALEGYKAIAVSCHEGASQATIAHIAQWTIQMAQRLKDYDCPPISVLNINCPQKEPLKLKPPVMCPIDTARYRDIYTYQKPPRGESCYWLSNSFKADPAVPGSDNDFLQKGHITCTFLRHGPVDSGDFHDFLQDT